MPDESSTIEKAADAIGNPFRGAASKPRGRPPKEKTTKAPRKKTPGPRRDLTDGLTLAWGGLGTVVSRTGGWSDDANDFVNGPVGRTMQFQAHYAGRQLSDLIKGNDVLYRWLSPIFGQKGLIGITNVIGAPVVVYMMQKDEALQALLLPALVSMLKPAIADHQKMTEKAEEMAAEFGATAEEEIMAALNIIGGASPGPPEPEPSPNGQGPEPE